MMLRALLDLAEREGLLENPSYGKRRVDFQLRLAADGQPVALIPLGEDGRGLPLSVPNPPKRTVAVDPAFLVDNAQYLLATPKRKPGAELSERAIGRATKCREAFALLLNDALEATLDPGLAAVDAFLRIPSSDAQAMLSKLTPDHEWTGDETIAPLLDSDGTTYIHERPAVANFWSERFAQRAEIGDRQLCLVTGEPAPAARLHGSIKRIPEGQTSGTSLVTFNEPAFESHGFTQGSNAPVSQRAAYGYVNALNWLLEKHGERRFRQGIAVGSDTVVVFWTRHATDTADVLMNLLDPHGEDEADLRTTYEAAWRGLAPREIDATAFYALTLSANASRVVVRDWLETTAEHVKARVARYFEDLALTGYDGPIPIGRLLRSLEAAPRAVGDRRGLPPALAAGLIRAALYGNPFPRELLQAALRRLRVPPGEAEWRATLHARVALIKAVLRRLHPDQEIQMSLDESNTSVPYLLGRLFAAIEKLQADALRDLNATIRDRYFGSASATPRLVFPRLLRVSVHHASKARAEGRDWAERVKGEIIERLPANGAFPSTLDLESQGLFAVGYYHQRQDFFRSRKSEGETNED